MLKCEEYRPVSACRPKPIVQHEDIFNGIQDAENKARVVYAAALYQNPEYLAIGLFVDLASEG